MPVPNPTIDTAIDLGVLPVIYTQNVDDGGFPQLVWVKFTARQTGIVGLFLYGNFADDYRPQTQVYIGPVGAPSLWLPDGLGEPGTEVPVQFPVSQDVTYYISARPGFVASAAPILHVLAEYFDQQAVPIGSIAVNDDTSGYPLALLSATSGDNLKFIQPFPAGEAGDVLTNGRVLVEDLDGDGGNGAAVLYAADYTTVLATIVSTTTGGRNRTLPIRTTPNGDAFYVAYKGFGLEDASVVRVDAAGNVGATVWTLTGQTQLAGMGVSPDETILYFVEAGSAQPVKRWDLVNNVALSDLVAGAVGHNIAGGRDQVVVLTDGRIVVPYHVTATGNDEVKVYNPDGTTNRTIALGNGVGVDRVASAIIPTHFWIWLQPDGITDEFREIDADTGATATALFNTEFETGVYQGAPAADPPRFGHSNSCPFWITRAPLTPPLPPPPSFNPICIVPLPNPVLER